MATTPDYPILGPARITAAGFAAVLRSNGSPAAGEAAGCYQAFINAGVDPAVGLAIFRKESTYGKFGRARPNRSWGNIRGGVGYPLDDKNFRRYPTWTVGAQDAARLLTVYGRNQIRPGKITSTVQTFPYVWAPSADGNAPDAYGDSLARWIGEWQRKYLPGGPGSYTPPAGAGTGQTVSTEVPSDATGATTTLAAYAGIDAGRRDNLWDVVRELTILNTGQANRPAYGGKFAREQIALGFSGATLIGRANTFLTYVANHYASIALNAGGLPTVPGPTAGDTTAGEVRLPVRADGKLDVDAMAADNTAHGGLDPFGVAGIAAAIASVPAALGVVVTNAAFLAAILGLIVVGAYLLARSR